jgi:hypothetical protein
MDHLLIVKSAKRLFTINDVHQGQINIYPGNNRLNSDQLEAIKNRPLGLKAGHFEGEYTIIDLPKGASFDDITTIKDEAIALQIAKHELNYSRLVRWRDKGENRPAVLQNIYQNISFLTDMNLCQSDHAEVAYVYNCTFKNWQKKQQQNQPNPSILTTETN